MAFSLYYEAKREQPLTEQEKEASKEIIEKYCSQYPFKRKVEDFSVYDVANYWLKCLTEITRLLTNSTWAVTFDDVDLILDSNEGWRFPTDEEYNRKK